MNILYVTYIDPRDTTFGGGQRTNFIWQALKKCGTVYTFCPLGGRVADQSDEQDLIHKASVDSPNPIALLLDRLILRFFGPVRWPFRSAKFIRTRIGWPEIKFDCVVCRYINNAALVSAWKLAPRCIIDIDDLPTQANKGLRGLKKLVLSLWQNFVLGKSTVSWFPNQDLIPQIAKVCDCRYLPNLAMPPKPGYQVSGKQKRQLMSVGWMAYRPNYEGVDWFVREVWPQVHAEFPDMSYVIAGKGAPTDFAARWSKVPGVKVLGFVDDLDTLYEESLAVVAPIFSGSGTCIKVQEAGLRGRKVFATPFAARGLNGNEPFVAVSSGASMMLSQVRNFLQSQKFGCEMISPVELRTLVEAEVRRSVDG